MAGRVLLCNREANVLSRLFTRSQWPIGLELGHRQVRLLQAGGSRSGWQVHALAERPLTGGPAVDEPTYHEAVAEAVAAIVSEGRFVGTELISAPPTSVVQVKNLRLPIMPAHELTEAVMWEANDRLKIDRNTNEIRFFNAGEVRQGTETRQEVILLAVPRTFIEAHVEAMAKLGLDVVAIDAPMAALARAVHEQAPALPRTEADDDAAAALASGASAVASDARLILQVGERETQVVIARGRQISFFKLIDFGLTSLRETWSAAGITVDDMTQPGEAAVRAASGVLSELVRELVLCLRYYSVTFRGDRPVQAVLAGAGAMPWLAKGLGEQTSMDVRCAELIADDAVARTTPGGVAAWCAACGLALHPRAGMSAGRAA
ncbi:pilus assembly protein PilM [Phycisphaerales bacterium AB-hyl4]|uniref:Pilus assembly protein PilM n=1 Tax=Natronomicrosphaera hydrolytica TaxID=3242702 RepID=A0ABV4U9C1_9BACT